MVNNFLKTVKSWFKDDCEVSQERESLSDYEVGGLKETVSFLKRLSLEERRVPEEIGNSEDLLLKASEALNNMSSSAKSVFQGNNLAFLDVNMDGLNKNYLELKGGDLNGVKKAAEQSVEKDGKNSDEVELQIIGLSVNKVGTNVISPKTTSNIKSHVTHSKKTNHISEIKKEASG